MLLTYKTKVLLAHVHTLLTEAEQLSKEGKGTALVKDEPLIRDMANKILDYCEQNGSTKKMLSTLSRVQPVIFEKSKVLYEICIQSYSKHIASVGDGHIPILYAFFMLGELRATGLIGLELPYTDYIETYKESELLQGEKRESKILKGKMITDFRQINKYGDCVHDTIKAVMNTKIKAKRRRK